MGQYKQSLVKQFVSAPLISFKGSTVPKLSFLCAREGHEAFV